MLAEDRNPVSILVQDVNYLIEPKRWMAQSRPPKRLPELRTRSNEVPPILEFSPRTWLASAQSQLQNGNRLVQEDIETGGANPILLEEAFINFKRAAV